MSDHARHTFFKSDMPTRKRLKGRKLRTEAAVAKKVRAACVERDHRSRLTWEVWLWGLDGVPEDWMGVPELVHMHVARRSKTRGMAPSIRFNTKTCLILPRAIHRLYDAKELTIEALTDQGADGPLRFTFRGKSYSE